MSRIEQHYMNGQERIEIRCGDILHVVHCGEDPSAVWGKKAFKATPLDVAFRVENPPQDIPAQEE
ncbi:hypothetical protein [Glutamicibacter soli]|uniref:hypothetical protein n=1 Tax=Glutamicibacter soli TaxID=453836 RepID=UPI003FD4D35F